MPSTIRSPVPYAVVRKICLFSTENKLVIHSYDSTGLLETLAINKPTLCIWNNKIDHVLETMKYKYQLLIDAKILHFNNNSIIEHLKVIYEQNLN